MDLSERPAQLTSSVARHPWELARFRFFQRVLARDTRHIERVLDAGAGDGWFARSLLPSLPATARVTCWDAHYQPEDLSAFQREAGERVQFTRERPSGRFDLILLLDVLEHVEHDRVFLQDLVDDVLAPGGALLFSVPAWQQLFTAHDQQLRHFRRYAPNQAAAVLRDAGLTIERRGGLFHSLLAPRALEKLREIVRPGGGNGASQHGLAWTAGPLATRAVSMALEADGRVSRLAADVGLELPGLSWWALCRKP